MRWEGVVGIGGLGLGRAECARLPWQINLPGPAQTKRNCEGFWGSQALRSRRLHLVPGLHTGGRGWQRSIAWNPCTHALHTVTCPNHTMHVHVPVCRHFQTHCWQRCSASLKTMRPSGPHMPFSGQVGQSVTSLRGGTADDRA